MARLPILATLLLVALPAAPAAGQAIPDHIPDLPGESLADREKERFIERHRDLLSRFFTMSSLDFAPVADPGPAYQTNLALGLDFRSGDALFVSLSGRRRWLEGDELRPGLDATLWYAGAGYALSGTRVLGESEAGRRSALNVKLGWWSGDASVLALDLSPTYEILAGSSWSVPAGVRLSVARIEDGPAAVARSFVGLTLGARWHVFGRDRVKLK